METAARVLELRQVSQAELRPFGTGTADLREAELPVALYERKMYRQRRREYDTNVLRPPEPRLGQVEQGDPAVRLVQGRRPEHRRRVPVNVRLPP